MIFIRELLFYYIKITKTNIELAAGIMKKPTLLLRQMVNNLKFGLLC